MNALDREGTFKARLLDWWIAEAKSGAVAVSCKLLILAAWDGAAWHDWGEYEEHQCRGSWWVVKRSGAVNTGAVEQLAESLGWDGDLGSVTGPPPQRTVQIVVKAEEYEGRVNYRASWMYRGDRVPRQGAGEEEVRQLQARFGSLLRAAASSAAPAPAAKGRADEPKAMDQRTALEGGGDPEPAYAGTPAGDDPPPVEAGDLPF